MLQVTEYEVNIPSLLGKKTVVAGDFHFRSKSAVDKIVEKINQEDADYVFLMGDYTEKLMFNSRTKVPKSYIEEGLSKIKAKVGVYSVLGNHDDADLKLPNLLVNDYVDIGDLRISGVDFWNPDIDKAIGKNPKSVWKGAGSKTSGSRSLILLSHNPDNYKYVPDEVDLVLSGHTHGGQLTLFGKPFWNPSKYGYTKGVYHNGKLIITKGVGTSMLHARLFCLPEIVVLR